MFIQDFTAALIISLLLLVLFAATAGRGRQRKGLFWVFLVIFLFTWAAGIWIRPLGPVLWGTHWVTFLIAGITIALVLAVVGYKEAPSGRRETLEALENMEKGRELEQLAFVTLSLFFWMLLVLLVALIIFHYLV